MSIVYKNRLAYFRNIKRLMYLHYKDFEFKQALKYYQIYKDLGGNLKLDTIIIRENENHILKG